MCSGKRADARPNWKEARGRSTTGAAGRLCRVVSDGAVYRAVPSNNQSDGADRVAMGL